MPKITCDYCGYRFSAKDDKKVAQKCPYCGRAGTLKQVKNAQDLLDEVSSLEEE